jgi:hypothetical protein
MWPFIQPINLIRYLLVLRVNGPLVRLPRYLPAELSVILGTIISTRLPTQEIRQWRKKLAVWEAYGGLPAIRSEKFAPLPEASWPFDAIFFPYPGKMDYRAGELIFCELKLLGDYADHGLFLETILPSLEAAGFSGEASWSNSTALWGHFEIDSVYAARGARWEPVVKAGRLDLRYRVNPSQWAEGLTFEPQSEKNFQQLTWVTPFDLRPSSLAPVKPAHSRAESGEPQPPDLRQILDALLLRMSILLPGKYRTVNDVWQSADANEQFSLLDALEQASHIGVKHHYLEPAPKGHPGQWVGRQLFDAPIPLAVLPYLELASILHIGRQTHLGCGTFYMD